MKLLDCQRANGSRPFVYIGRRSDMVSRQGSIWWAWRRRRCQPSCCVAKDRCNHLDKHVTERAGPYASVGKPLQQKLLYSRQAHVLAPYDIVDRPLQIPSFGGEPE